MATSSLLGGELPSTHASGKTADLLGPSDSSDSGSDAMGEFGPEELSSDSDRHGTGERGSVETGRKPAGSDILPDRVQRGPTGEADRPGRDDVADLSSDED